MNGWIMRMSVRGRVAALGVLLLSLTVARAAAPATDAYPNPKDVTQLWTGFDPSVLPFDIELQKSWEENGARIEQFYFTSEVWEGQAVRVFAYLGVPAGTAKVPGILHLHGGGQTANLEWVRFWTSRGYAIASIDWLGKWPDRTDYTKWGKVRGDMAVYGNSRDTTPSVRYAPWYHWAIAARRTLTLLERKPNVDPSRLGVFGVSMGAALTWMVAGTDPRVKTAVPIYGCGWNTYPEVHSGGYQHPVPAEIDLWRATMEPETYARYITCPLLLLSATNDFATNMDRCPDSLARVPADTRESLTLRYSHHLEPDQGRTLVTWMDWRLRNGPAWAKPAALRLEARNGVLHAVAAPDRTGEVSRVVIAYATGSKRPQARFWRSAQVRREGEAWVASLLLVDASQPVRAVCNVTYRGGYTLTSTTSPVVPSGVGVARANDTPSLLIDDFAAGVDDWTFGPAYTDPYVDWSYLRVGAGPDGTAALTFNTVAWGNAPKYVVGTHKVGDAKWASPPGAALSLRCHAVGSATLEVHVLQDHWGPRAKEYVANVELDGGSDWRRIKVTAAQCTAKDGSKLPDFRDIDRIDFVGQSPAGEPPSFARVEWTPP
jgi:dienelactone hydrolase